MPVLCVMHSANKATHVACSETFIFYTYYESREYGIKWNKKTDFTKQCPH